MGINSKEIFLHKNFLQKKNLFAQELIKDPVFKYSDICLIRKNILICLLKNYSKYQLKTDKPVQEAMFLIDLGINLFLLVSINFGTIC